MPRSFGTMYLYRGREDTDASPPFYDLKIVIHLLLSRRLAASTAWPKIHVALRAQPLDCKLCTPGTMPIKQAGGSHGVITGKCGKLRVTPLPKLTKHRTGPLCVANRRDISGCDSTLFPRLRRKQLRRRRTTIATVQLTAR